MCTHPVAVCSIQRCDAGGPTLLHTAPSLTYPRYYSYQPLLIRGTTTGSLIPGILTHPLTPYLSKITYFVPPYRVVVEIKSVTLVSVVCVHSACTFRLPLPPIVLADLLTHILPAASSYVLATAANPFGGFLEIGEDPELAIVRNDYCFLAASACGIRTDGRTVLIQVLPTFGTAPLSTLAHKLVPFLTLVSRNMSLDEATVLGVGLGWRKP